MVEFHWNYLWFLHTKQNTQKPAARRKKRKRKRRKQRRRMSTRKRRRRQSLPNPVITF